MRRCNKLELNHLYLRLEGDDWGVISSKIDGKKFDIVVKINPEGEFTIPGFMAAKNHNDIESHLKVYHLSIDDFEDLDIITKGPIISDILLGLKNNATIRDSYRAFLFSNWLDRKWKSNK